MLTVNELNNLANHPAVAPFVAPGHVDLTKAYDRLLIVGDAAGAVVLDPVAPGIYEWHWLCGPTCRGKAALELGRKAILEAFTNPNVRAIHGRTPRGNRAARLMNRALGAKPVGTSVDVLGQECSNYLLERDSCQLEPSLEQLSAV